MMDSRNKHLASRDGADIPLNSLMYISRSTIAPDEAEAVVAEIVATSVARNTEAGLTGALLFTGTHFAQVLEGEGSAIQQLMQRVKDDTRHEQIVIVDESPLDRRKFGDWSMAYFGPSQFVSRHVTRLLNDPSSSEKRRAADWLGELLREFSAHPGSAI